MTERELRVLRNSWPQVFRDEIFPYIDEELFSVLYSDAPSRPNAPANVTFGAMLLKEALHLSDDEVVHRLMFDISFQYAQRADTPCAWRLAELGSELIYTCVANVVEHCHKDERDGLIDGMEHYLDLDDFNGRFYHATGEGSRSEACLSSEPTRLMRGGSLAWTGEASSGSRSF